MTTIAIRHPENSNIFYLPTVENRFRVDSTQKGDVLITRMDGFPIGALHHGLVVPPRGSVELYYQETLNG